MSAPVGDHASAGAAIPPPVEAVTLDDVLAARGRIVEVVRQTPMLRKEALSQRYGVPVYLKGEHLQRTGSFKVRGALNLVSQLSAEERARGVVAASAGNHAQGVAVAASAYGARARIFMPEDATLSKIEATRAYGAEVVLGGDSVDAALAAAREHAEHTGAVFVHPFDDPRIIAGQGTVALEILEEVPDIGTLIVPIGGGGLFAGIATVVRAMRPECRLVGVQASASATIGPSIASGHPVTGDIGPTMADGIAIRRPGDIPFRVIRDAMTQLVVVDDDHISMAMLWLIERAKQIVEGAGASTLAALQSGDVEASGPTVCLLSGGNIDPMALMPVIRHGLTSAGRFLTIWTTLPDRPGELSRILSLLAEAKVNILSIEHQREGVHLRVGHTRVEMTLQTRNRQHVQQVFDVLHAAGCEVHEPAH